MVISEELRARIRIQAGDRCGYCLSRQMYVLGILHIEHLLPKSLGGSDEEDNLWLACSLCNTYKGSQTHAIDPVTNTRISPNSSQQMRSRSVSERIAPLKNSSIW